MKRIAKLMSLLIGAVCLVLLPKATALEASAATTFQLMYKDSQWYFQEGSSWDSTGSYRELYYLNEGGELKDGDTVVIVCSDDEATVQKDELQLNAALSNLTFSPGATAIVKTNGVTDCYVCTGATGVVNGNVTNGYVYDTATAQFNNNVTNLYVISSTTTLDATVACTGTVGHLNMTCQAGGSTYDYYNFQADKLRITYGDLKTESGYYETSSTAASSETATTSSETAATADSASSDEYDDVPKTGESQATILLLLGVAIVCMIGSIRLRKQS